MKTSAALFSALLAAFVAVDVTNALQDASVVHLRVHETEAGKQQDAVWADSDDAEIGDVEIADLAAAAVPTTASKAALKDCPGPRDEEFASKITHARVEPISGGFKIHYRVTGDRIRFRCACKNADDWAFQSFFGHSKYEKGSSPGVRCYTKDPKKDVKALQGKVDVITTDTVFDLIAGYTRSSEKTC